MKIQVLGPGCGSCKQLHEQVLKAVEELDMSVEVEYITEIQKIIEAGIMTSPTLIIDGKVVTAGIVPSVDKIKKLISDKNKGDKDNPDNRGCSCGGKC